MSQIKLDNAPGALPIEPVLSEPVLIEAGLFSVETAPGKSFDEHLQRAQTRPDEPITRDATDSTPQPNAERRSAETGKSTDTRPGEKSPEQTPPENATESDRPEASETKSDAEESAPSENSEAGSQNQPEQEQDDGGAGEINAAADPGQLPTEFAAVAQETEAVVKVDQAPVDPTADVLDDPAATDKAPTDKAESGESKQSDPQRVLEKLPLENAPLDGQALAGKSADTGEATAESASQNALPVDPSVEVLEEDAGQNTDRIAKEDATARHTAPQEQGDGAGETAEQGQRPESQASQSDTSRRHPGTSRKRESAVNRVGEDGPKQPLPNAASAPSPATPQVDLETAARQPADPSDVNQGTTSDATSRPASGGTSEVAADARVHVAPRRGSRTGSAQQAGDPTEPGQVDRVRFVRRVARAFQAIDGRSGSVRLRLSPPELGSLRLEIAVRNGVMTARVEAETQTARNLLLDNLPALRERLAQQDIKIEQFNVDVSDRSPGGLPEQTPGHEQSGEGDKSGGSSAAGPDGDAEGRRASDAGAVHRPGEGTRLNVVI